MPSGWWCQNTWKGQGWGVEVGGAESCGVSYEKHTRGVGHAGRQTDSLVTFIQIHYAVREIEAGTSAWHVNKICAQGT